MKILTLKKNLKTATGKYQERKNKDLMFMKMAHRSRNKPTPVEIKRLRDSIFPNLGKKMPTGGLYVLGFYFKRRNYW